MSKKRGRRRNRSSSLPSGIATEPTASRGEGPGHPIKLAYDVMDDWGRKRDVPKALAGAITHAHMTQSTAQDRYRKIPKRPNNPPLETVQQMSHRSLRIHLSTLSFFLKADKPKEGSGMDKFHPQPEEQILSSEELSTFARQTAAAMGNVNENKLKRLCASFTAARDKYEALAVLARFYALTGVDRNMINYFVKCLERYSFPEVKQLMLQTVVFWRACK